MCYICGVVLGISLIAIFCISYKRDKDIFSPLCFFSFYQFIQYVPSLLLATEEDNYSGETGKLLLFFAIESAFILSVCFGVLAFRKKGKQSSRPFDKTKVIPLWVVVLLFSISVINTLKSIFSAGGFAYVISNPQAAYRKIVSGSGLSSIIGSLSLVSVLMQIYRISFFLKNNKRKIKVNVFILIGMVAVSMASTLIFSRRAPALEVLLYALFGFHYLVRRIRIKDFFKPIILFILVAVALIIVVMPALRQGVNYSFNIKSLFTELNMLDRDAETYSYFKTNDFWLGKSYVGLFTAFIPSVIFPNKYPVDDGMYLCNILNGYSVTPPVPTSELPFYSSYPFSSPGALYANFSIVGVIIGGFVLGCIYSRVYYKLNTKKNYFYVLFYVLIIYQFEMTSLGIVQALIPLVVAFVVYKLFSRKGYTPRYVTR